MSIPLNFHSFAAQVAGVAATSPAPATTSGAAALPNNSSGARPRYIHVFAPVVTAIALGGATVAATANHFTIPAGAAVVLATGPGTHFAVFQATVGNCVIVPLEDF